MNNDKTNSSLELLLTISRELATTLDLQEALTKVILLSMKNVGAERGSLIAFNSAHEPIAAAIVIEDRVVPQTLRPITRYPGQGPGRSSNSIPSTCLD